MKILVKRNDGGVTIVTPAKGVTKAQLVKDAKATKGYVSHREVKQSDMPNNRLFRDAWTDTTASSSVDIDLDKARGIIRAKRDMLLEELDKEALKEQRKPNGNLSVIDSKAQKLRDITLDPRFNSTKVEDLEDILTNELIIE